MSYLVNKQHKFATCVAKLISHADQLCHTITLGDAKNCHKVRLAIEKYYAILHNYWDKIGGAPRIADDLIHFSFTHEGMR